VGFFATSHADEVVPECVVKHRWQCKSQSFLRVEIIHQWGHDIWHSPIFLPVINQWQSRVELNP
jgi:hypothetical protein